MVGIEVPVIKLTGKYCTDAVGIGRLLEIYEQAHQFQNLDVQMDCQGLEHLDANLVSLLAALDFRLLQERNVTLQTDFAFLKRRFAFLFHNGFLRDVRFNETDPLQRPLQLTQIDINDEKKFIEFLSSQLMCHKAIDHIDDKLKRVINSEIIEIYTNIQKHSKSEYPFFACGHHYPTAGIFKITFVDLGVGFLPPIRTFTNGLIQQDGEAIQWAMEDYNSSTGELLAGNGLKGILDFCKENGGKLQVISGNDFWSTDTETATGHKYISMATRFFACAGVP